MLSQFVFVLKLKIKQAFDEAFGYLKRVIVTPAVYPRFITLTFRALGRNHIASTSSPTIAMLCFN